MLAVTQTTWTQQPRTHDLLLTPEHVHWGYYDSRVPPVLRITSGDRVRVETMVAGGLQRVRLAGARESEIPESLKAVELGVTERGPGVHPNLNPGLSADPRIVRRGQDLFTRRELSYVHPACRGSMVSVRDTAVSADGFWTTIRVRFPWG